MRKLTVAAVAAVACGRALADFSCQLVDPLEWTYVDSKVGDRPAFAETDVPFGGVADATVLFNGLEKGKPLAVSCPTPGAEWFEMVPVTVERNTGLAGFCVKPGETNTWAVRQAPYRVFEAMRPLGDATVVPSAETLALRFRLRQFAPKAGETNLTFRFVQSGREKTLPLKVRVHDVRLTPVGKNSFKYTNWFSFPNFATYHGLELGSEACYEMIARYARLAAEGRQNCAWIPLSLVFDVKDGVPALDEAKLVRIVDIYTEAGIWWLEGGHFCRFNGGWGAKEFLAPFSKTVVSTTPEGAAAIRRVAEQLMAAIERHGWKDRWLQHVADEPDVINAKEYRMTAGTVRRYMPGIRLVDAIENCAAGAGTLDILCPKVHVWQQNRADYDFQRTNGCNEVWCYTCCSPGGRWLNRTLDWHLLKPLYVFWNCSAYDITGFLHWGYNMYQNNANPFGRTTVDNWGTNGGNSLPPGDTHVVYPGTDGPWSGARFEATRQGAEDYELFAVLKRRDPAKAAALTRRLVRSFDDYTIDVPLYRRVRRELLAACAQKKGE